LAQNYPTGGGIDGQIFQARFEAANTTHDGHLTIAQAEAAGLKIITRHFSEIDTQNKGYITLDDIQVRRDAHPMDMGRPQSQSN
jgi:hypothetical protein